MHSMDRREFMKRTLGAPAALGFPMIVPRRVLGRGVTAATNRGVHRRRNGQRLMAWLTKDDVRSSVCDARRASGPSAWWMEERRPGLHGLQRFSRTAGTEDVDAVSVAPGELACPDLHGSGTARSTSTARSHWR
jgi:hypothetical protein